MDSTVGMHTVDELQEMMDIRKKIEDLQSRYKEIVKRPLKKGDVSTPKEAAVSPAPPQPVLRPVNPAPAVTSTPEPAPKAPQPTPVPAVSVAAAPKTVPPPPTPPSTPAPAPISAPPASPSPASIPVTLTSTVAASNPVTPPPPTVPPAAPSPATAPVTPTPTVAASKPVTPPPPSAPAAPATVLVTPSTPPSPTPPAASAEGPAKLKGISGSIAAVITASGKALAFDEIYSLLEAGNYTLPSQKPKLVVRKALFNKVNFKMVGKDILGQGQYEVAAD